MIPYQIDTVKHAIWYEKYIYSKKTRKVKRVWLTTAIKSDANDVYVGNKNDR